MDEVDIYCGIHRFRGLDGASKNTYFFQSLLEKDYSGSYTSLEEMAGHISSKVYFGILEGDEGYKRITIHPGHPGEKSVIKVTNEGVLVEGSLCDFSDLLNFQHLLLEFLIIRKKDLERTKKIISLG